jgi:hypothetical protein
MTFKSSLHECCVQNGGRIRVAKAGERWPVGQGFWSASLWGPDRGETSILRKGLGGKDLGVK